MEVEEEIAEEFEVASSSRRSSASSVASRASDLAPVRTGRETPTQVFTGSRPTSATSITSESLEKKKKNPLPPIGTEKVNDANEEEELEVQDPVVCNSEVLATTEAAKKTERSLSRPPRIVSYRRELEDSSFTDSESSSGESGRNSRRKRKNVIATKEVKRVTGFDGLEHVMISQDCQTDWDWVDVMTKQSGPSSRASFLRDDSPSSLSLTSDTEKAHVKRCTTSSSKSQRSVISADRISSGVNSVAVISRISSRMGRKASTGKSVSIALDRRSAATSRTLGSEAGTASEPAHAVPSREDEYGIPVLNMSSDSETSDDDDSVYQYHGDEETTQVTEANSLPSIGPPQILQYQKESLTKDLDSGSPETRKAEVENTQPEEDLDGELIQFSTEAVNKRSISGGIFQGACEFCGKDIKTFPSVNEQKSVPPAELYCCDDYRNFVDYVVKTPLLEEKDKKMIDIKPHAPFGSKQARRAAKERAAQRMRERELARQQAVIAAGISGAGGGPGGGGGGGTGGGGGGGGPTNFYQFARQMKTIQYQLSSHKCLEEGWTLRPPSPLFEGSEGTEMYEPDPVLPSWADAGSKTKRERQLVEKLYEDGSIFLVMFPDGTGNVFYPSGQVAITITSSEQGLYTYIVHEEAEEDEDAHLLAVFDSTGHVVSHFINGAIRLHMDQIGGLEMDTAGIPKRRWTWRDQTSHVHAPPIQPITFALSRHLAVRIAAQDKISLTFSCQRRGCRFQVASKLKLVSPPVVKPDEHEIYRHEVMSHVQLLLDRVSNVLKFPKSPKFKMWKDPPVAPNAAPPPMPFTPKPAATRPVSKVMKDKKDSTQTQPVVIVN